MGNFWTDLERHLADYEREEREADWWDDLVPDWRELSVEPEERDLIDENDVTDRPDNLRRTA